MKQILFNTEMVKVILNGNKTQTRRPVKKDLIINLETDKNDPDYLYVQDKYGDSHHLLECAPYYKNQILYVRETFADIPETAPGNIRYKASATEADLKWFEEKGWNWRPSIHMPKKLARIFLKVINVRIERLQDINIKNAAEEGFKYLRNNDGLILDSCKNFKRSWNEIYKKKGYGWDEDPWIWVIEFEQINKPE